LRQAGGSRGLAAPGLLYGEEVQARGRSTTFTDAQACEIDWLRRHDLGQELTWRLTRLHELRRRRNEREREAPA
jgi:hypothetical protein